LSLAAPLHEEDGLAINVERSAEAEPMALETRLEGLEKRLASLDMGSDLFARDFTEYGAMLVNDLPTVKLSSFANTRHSLHAARTIPRMIVKRSKNTMALATSLTESTVTRARAARESAAVLRRSTESIPRLTSESRRLGRSGLDSERKRPVRRGYGKKRNWKRRMTRTTRITIRERLSRTRLKMTRRR